MLQSLDHLDNSLHYVHNTPVLRSPELDAELQVRPHWVLSREESLPSTYLQYFARCQDSINLICCKGALLGHFQLDVHWNPQVHFFRDAFQSVDSQHALMPGAVPPQVQDLALLVELHEVHFSPYLQPLQITLKGRKKKKPGVSTSPLSFVSSTDLLRVLSHHAGTPLCTDH